MTLSAPAHRPPPAHAFQHQPMLGTVVDVRVGTDDAQLATDVNELVVGQIERLEAVFSAFAPGSELCRWRRGLSFPPSPEFGELMGRVLDWHVRSEGRFNPMSGVLSELWRLAAASGDLPADDLLAAAAASIADPRFVMAAGMPVATGDCSKINLNAIAKGFITDRAVDAAVGLSPQWVCVNAGGDLAHRGSGAVRVGIENPHRPYDNEPPLVTVDVSNAALATSGDARRGFRVGTKWFGHVLDPRTGFPVEAIASITVVAHNAMTADVVATVAGVMTPAGAVKYLHGVDGVIAGLVIDRNGQQWPSSQWEDLVVTGS